MQDLFSLIEFKIIQTLIIIKNIKKIARDNKKIPLAIYK